MNRRFKFLSVRKRKAHMKKQAEMLEKTDEALGIVLSRAKRAEQERDEMEEALNALYLLVEHETDLPDSAANGVTDPGGNLDEGVTRAAEIMETAAKLLKTNEIVKEEIEITEKQIEYEMFWNNQWLTVDAVSLRDIFEGLEIASKKLQSMHEDGVKLDPKSGIEDDYARLVTTDPEVAEKYKMVSVEE